jgi:hypothetical protein
MHPGLCSYECLAGNLFALSNSEVPMEVDVFKTSFVHHTIQNRGVLSDLPSSKMASDTLRSMSTPKALSDI